MATNIEIPYLILRADPQAGPHEPFSILAIGYAHLPEDGTVRDLLDDAASVAVSHLPASLRINLDAQRVEVETLAYTLFDPISSFIGRSRTKLIEELGDIDRAFLDKRAKAWPPDTPLSRLGIKTEGNVGQLLLILDNEIHYKYFSREEILDAACNRDTPSASAHNSNLLATQNINKPDAIYNGRPVELTPPPIEIYHPVFATFRRKMAQPTKDFDFTATELEFVHDLIANSLPFYKNEGARIVRLNALRQLVHQEVLMSVVIRNGDGKKIIPDGIAYTKSLFAHNGKPAILFTELTNGVGDGGCDPISQSQCDYIAFYSADLQQPLRNACCCPAFLIGIAGPFISISGAVFVDRFISQNLTDYLYLGASPFIGSRYYEIAKVLRVLKECLADLDEYYSELANIPPPLSPTVSRRQPLRRSPQSELPPSSKMSTSVLFPHFRKFSHATSGQDVELEYTHRLQAHNPEKALFKALARPSPSSSHVASTVVVKFTPTYCPKAHDLLQKRSLAPRLWLCEKVESVGMYVVVMDFIPGRRISATGLSRDKADALREALQILHENDLVYGDLRSPNVFLDHDGKPMLIDFDWAGRAGEATYPPDINMDPTIGWHAGVCRNGLILREHDMFMLARLEQGEEDSE